MKIIIVEDEPQAANYLVKLIGLCEPNADVIAKLDSIESALAWLSTHDEPDLIFSDVELSDGMSFTLWELYTPSCPIVFTTAYDNYFREAFNTNGVDYILKPFEREAIAQSFEKFHRLKKSLVPDHSALLGSLSCLLQGRQESEPRYRRRFSIKRYHGIELIEVDSIAMFRLDHTGLYALAEQGKSYPLHDYTLTKLEEELDPRKFFRLNRNEVNNIDFVKTINPDSKDKLKVSLCDDLKCISSSHKTPLFRRWIEEN